MYCFTIAPLFPQLNWTTMLASFNREHLLKHKASILESAFNADIVLPMAVEKYISVTPVSCSTLTSLVEKYSLTRLDFLQVDAEGSDFDVLQAYDFSVRPTVIHYEHFHLCSKKVKCKRFLKNRGYLIYEYSPMDTIAIDAKILFHN